MHMERREIKSQSKRLQHDECTNPPYLGCSTKDESSWYVCNDQKSYQSHL